MGVLCRFLCVSLALLALWAPTSQAYKYLFLSVHIRSHVSEQTIVAKELVANGHEVYMAVPELFPWKQLTDTANLQLIYAKKKNEPFQSQFVTGNFGKANKVMGTVKGINTAVEKFEMYAVYVINDTLTMMSDDNFLQEIKNEKFDMAIVDGVFFAPFLTLIPFHLGIPFISLSARFMPAGMAFLPSFVPQYGLLNFYSDNMDFWERLSNTWTLFYNEFYSLQHKRTEGLALYPDPQGNYVKDWSELQLKSSLFISTRNHYIGWPQPLYPNYIMTPGITQKPAAPLAEEFDQYMNSHERIIIVSFGSVAKLLDTEVVDKLMDVFPKFPQYNFLFKLSEENQKLLKTKPNNVYFSTWIPQNDLLGHPNTKGFVTHCGNNGQHEGAYHGVPMIGIPLFADQFNNCFRIGATNLGVCLDALIFTREQFANAITKITTDPTVLAQVKKISGVMKSEPLPTKTILYWIEHVTEFGGDHLRTAGVDLPWYSFWMFDILLFLLSIFFAVTLVVCLVIKAVCCSSARKAKSD